MIFKIAKIAFSLLLLSNTACDVKSDAEQKFIKINASNKLILNGATSKFPVEIILTNISNKTLNLTAPNPCAILRWKLFDSDGQLVQEPPRKLCSQVLASSKLAPKQQLKKTKIINLNNQNLTTGKSYQLKLEFWRNKAQHNFTIH